MKQITIEQQALCVSFVMDLGGTVIHMCRKQMNGHNLDGKKIFDIIPDSEKKPTEKHIKKVITGKNIKYLSKTNLGSDYRIILTPLQNHNKEVVAVHGYATPITSNINLSKKQAHEQVCEEVKQVCLKANPENVVFLLSALKSCWNC